MLLSTFLNTQSMMHGYSGYRIDTDLKKREYALAESKDLKDTKKNKTLLWSKTKNKGIVSPDRERYALFNNQHENPFCTIQIYKKVVNDDHSVNWELEYALTHDGEMHISSYYLTPSVEVLGIVWVDHNELRVQTNKKYYSIYANKELKSKKSNIRELANTHHLD